MTKPLIVAAALALLASPALAQQTPGGQSSGGPARVGIPGQVEPSAAPARRAAKPRKAKRGHKHR